MNREQLQDIFRQPYNAQTWQELLINLFGANEIRQTPSTLTSDSNEKVDGFRVGTLTTPDRHEIGLFAFEIKGRMNLKLNRVGLRSLVKSYTRLQVDAAIVVFYDATHWRLSFICDIKEQKTASKRYTYVFGNPDESYRTASAMLAKLSDRGKPSFEDIKAAFSVEALSKDFFKGYKEQYAKFCKHIVGTEKWQRDYVKKMMGRLVFLQFLQKKGWMNGDYNYMQSLFANSPYQDDYLEQVLEPLFFGVLNTKPEDREAIFKKNGWDLSLLEKWKDITYLNGGLFEADDNDKKREQFSKEHFIELFDFFSHYNFTIDENDPNDAEVGIDPEMLGHIFENLLEDNKDKGAFYTPKEIVQYMCRQSLIEYLQSKLGKHLEIENFINTHETGDRLDKKNFIAANATEIERLLDKVKICDPAIGSGAFPMGILSEIFHAKMALDMTLNRANVKKNIIQNSIYGVDIEQGAVDIARLRFWLSLVVDEDVPQPLPNLDYKIMCGNSLLSRYELNMPFDDVFKEYNRGKSDADKMSLDKYRRLVADYTNTSDHTQKADFRKTIEEIKSAFRTELSKGERNKASKLKGQIYTLEAPMLFGERTKQEKDELKKLKAQLVQLEKEQADIINNKLYEDAFEWRFEFPQLLDDNGTFVGFDIVIGNPPYFVYQGTAANEIIELRKKDELKIAFGGKLNAYKLFLAKALHSLTKKGGITTFIFQNSFLADKQAELLRKYVLENTQIIVIDSFPERDSKKKRVFESVKMSVCIVFIQNANTDNEFYVNFWQDRDKKSGTRTVFKREDIRTIDSESYIIPRIKSEFKSTIIKIKSTPNQFKLKCYEGELNMTFHKHLFSKDKNNPIILKGASIQRYFYTFNMSQGEIEYLDELDYLSQYTNSDKANHHKYDRIAMQGMTGANDQTRLVMTLIPKGIYLANSCNYIIPSKEYDVRYILSVLNSKLINWYFRCFSTNSNVNGYEVDGLPIPFISKDDQKVFVEIINKILEAKKADPKADTTALEAQIDQMVYALYNLTSDEIALIEK